MHPLAAVVVAATLLADTSAVTPGRPFRLGVKLTAPEGWHLYWSNPGESGLPTKATLVPPPDTAVRPWIWPMPKRFLSPGDLTSYGYERELLLWCPAGVGPESRAGSYTFRAEVSWMACREVCVTGKASLALVLPAGAARPVNQELFESWKDSAPVDAADSLSPASANWTPRGRSGLLTLKLRWSGRAGRVAWVAPADPRFRVDDVTAGDGGPIGRVTLRLRPQPGTNPDVAEVPLVVAYTDQRGAPRGLTVRIRTRRQEER